MFAMFTVPTGPVMLTVKTMVADLSHLSHSLQETPWGSTQLLGAVLIPMQQAVPNPFCGVYNLVLPWAGGAALLGLLLAVLGFFLRNLAPHASVQLENGLKGVGIGLFLMGLILQPNFLNAVATALGASGMDFNCPANP